MGQSLYKLTKFQIVKFSKSFDVVTSNRFPEFEGTLWVGSLHKQQLQESEPKRVWCSQTQDLQ